MEYSPKNNNTKNHNYKGDIDKLTTIKQGEYKITTTQHKKKKKEKVKLNENDIFLFKLTLIFFKPFFFSLSRLVI